VPGKLSNGGGDYVREARYHYHLAQYLVPSPTDCWKIQALICNHLHSPPHSNTPSRAKNEANSLFVKMGPAKKQKPES
jgi:hypothetical protein